MFLQRALLSLGLLLFGLSVNVTQAYVPLLDEVEGVNANTTYYLILPAWENLDPNQKQHAYFIIPKFLVIAGNAVADQPDYQFGVSHRGYTLFANGTADYPPSIDLLATVTLYSDDAAVKKIQDELTKRDTALGLQPPVFPTPPFSKWQGSVAVAGVASATTLAPLSGGYPGQLVPLHVITGPDAYASLILDLPTSAGRDAAVWGISMVGTIHAYGNRLDCQITVHNRKVYDHFKARASGQAYWGIIKADLGTELKSMDQDQSIDFGKCRGSSDQIDKIVMPVWSKITDLSDQNGSKMFSEMVKSLNGIPNHPEAASGGWGFQLSAGWEQVKYTDQTTINFNIAYQTDWDMPLGMNFNTTCNKWKTYFINNTDNTKPCVSPNDFPAIRDKQRQCYTNFSQQISTQYPAEIRSAAYKRLSAMGCAWDGSFASQLTLAPLSLKYSEAAASRLCRSKYFKLVAGWHESKLLGKDQALNALNEINASSCTWNAGPAVARAVRDAKEQILKEKEVIKIELDKIPK